MELNNYHLEELRIAQTSQDARRIMPPVSEEDVKVLDVGCGAGQTLFATRFAPGTTVVGIDLDETALGLGKQLDKKISFVCARAERLPFESDCFDFAYSRVALPYMHLHHTLSEMWRVLKTGGRIWLVLHPYSLVLEETLRALRRLSIKRVAVCVYVMSNGMAIHLFGKEFHLPFRKDYYESFQTIKGIRKLLQQAGFADIGAERNGFFIATARKIDSTLNVAA